MNTQNPFEGYCWEAVMLGGWLIGYFGNCEAAKTALHERGRGHIGLVKIKPGMTFEGEHKGPCGCVHCCNALGVAINSLTWEGMGRIRCR